MPRIINPVSSKVHRRRQTVLRHPQLTHLLRGKGGVDGDIDERISQIFEAYSRPRPVLTEEQARLAELDRRLRATPHGGVVLTRDSQEEWDATRRLVQSLPQSERARVLEDPPRRLTDEEEQIRGRLFGAVSRSARLVPPDKWRVLAAKLGSWFAEFLSATGAPIAVGEHEAHGLLLSLREDFRSQFPGLRTDRDLHSAIALFGHALGVVKITDATLAALVTTPIDANARAMLDRQVRGWIRTQKRRRQTHRRKGKPRVQN